MLRGETKGADSAQGENRMHEGFFLKKTKLRGDNKRLRGEIKGPKELRKKAK